MPTIRLAGTITALSPIMITRVDQGDNLLTMNVVRNEAMVRVHAIPGENLKGALRSAALRVCVDAAREAGGATMTLDNFYLQSVGGLGFADDKVPLGGSDESREGQPILSLFGAASPKLRGRLIVGAALARPAVGAPAAIGSGLPAGVRLDALMGEHRFSELLSEEDRNLWSRKSAIIADSSEAKGILADADRKLKRARGKGGIDLAPLEAEVEAAQAAVDAIKSGKDFTHAVQRPLPVKRAAPAGTTYDHSIEAIDATPSEVGLLLAALQEWGQLSRVGGSRTTGYGSVAVDYAIAVRAGDGPARLRPWVPAGRVTIDPDGTRIASEHPDIVGAMAEWQATEADIRANTKVFG